MRIYQTLFILLLCFSCTGPSEKEKQVKDDEDITRFYHYGISDSLSLNDRRIYLDKALKISEDGDSLLRYILYSKSNLHYLLQEYDSLSFYGSHLIKQAEQAKDFVVLGKYYHLLGFYHSKVTFDSDSAFYYQNQSKNKFLAAGDSTNTGRRLLSMGIIQHNKNDFFGSKETLTEAMPYFINENDSSYMASTMNELATSHRKLLNYRDAIDYYKSAIKIANSRKSISIFKNNLATAYIDNMDYGKAIQLLQEIKNDSSLKNGTSAYARVSDNLAYASWLDKEPVMASRFLEALDIRKTENDRRGQIASYTHLGEYFTLLNPIKAERYLDTVIQLSRQLRNPKAEQDALKYMMDLQPKNVEIRNRYVFLQDSLYRVGLKVKTQFAKMKYDDELKQRAILELEAETANKNAALSEQKIQKTIWLSISGILLIMGVSFFYGIRQRYKKEKLLEIYATEQRISMRLHDELANDIYGTMTKIQQTPVLDKGLLLNDLEHIYQQTRIVSHENGTIPTDSDFGVNLRQLLAGYQSSDTVVTVKGLENARWEMVSDYKKVAVYRALNELMVNMKKHSGANLAAILFEQDSKKCIIKYADNGKGSAQNIKIGVGLQNTENRIKNIEGTFSFERQHGKGFKAIITFPV